MTLEVISGDFIKIDNDLWEDSGKRFLVHSAIYRENSTAVNLVIEYNDEIIYKTLARNQIYKAL